MASSSIKRSRITLNVLVQIITYFAIVVMLNLFAFKHYHRLDLSQNHQYTLSEQTHNIVGSLKKPVDFIVFFTSNPDIARDTKALLSEYTHASKKKVRVEIVDPYLNLSRAREVASKYKLGTTENVIIVDNGERSKLVNASDMAEYEPALSPLNPPRLKAFKGEEALTSALIEVSEHEANKIYVLAGHGEPTLTEDSSLGNLRLLIERQNITFEPLNLAEVDAIPADAKMLLLIGPKYDFTEPELALLRLYWEKKGRLFAFLNPGSSTPELAAFFHDQGITVNDDRVLRTVPFGQVTGVLKDITANFLGGSPITQRLENVTIPFLGGTQSLTLDPERVKESRVKLTPLIRAAKGLWAEKHYNLSDGNNIYFDPKVDLLTPFIAATAEKGALNDDRVQLGSSRLVVIGNSAFIDAPALSTQTIDFVLGGVNWLIDREPLIGITPKTVQEFSLNLTQSQVSSLSFLTLIAIPGAAALLGFFTWLKRRR